MTVERRKIEFYFATGDCTGCAYYNAFNDCFAGHCETIRTCALLEIGKDYEKCLQHIMEIKLND